MLMSNDPSDLKRPWTTKIACVRGSPMVPLVGNICTNLIVIGTIGKEIGANGKNGNTIGTNMTNGTNVTNQWYHLEEPEHTHSQ